MESSCFFITDIFKTRLDGILSDLLPHYCRESMLQQSVSEFLWCVPCRKSDEIITIILYSLGIDESLNLFSQDQLC